MLLEKIGKAVTAMLTKPTAIRFARSIDAIVGREVELGKAPV